ncbi:MAG: hypothetical protein LBE70_00460, partial [Nitrososphaerota archaeon]|nr:hypothetical protein [Nitrososphaerota archaeon]
MNVKANSVLRVFGSKETLGFTSLLLMLMLVFAPLISVANETSTVPDVVVRNETELLNAISTAPNKKSFVIGINEDIILKNSLEIPKNKNITLVIFNVTSSFVSLIGRDNMDTIIVKDSGTLVLLNGVVITHINGDNGRGVYIERKGA